MALWTQSVLTSARHIYATAGFTRTASEPRGFRQDLVAETRDMDLESGPRSGAQGPAAGGGAPE